jgi:hypothetical protein
VCVKFCKNGQRKRVAQSPDRGLPGAGKTTLARELAPLLSAVVFNADDVRQNINRYLGFSPEDRIEQARRIGWLCNKVACADHEFHMPHAGDAGGNRWHLVRPSPFG